MPNQFALAFADLIAVQTEVLGAAILATVGAFAVNKPALISEVDMDAEFVEGGIGQGGGFTLEMLITDFSSQPTKGTAISANGSAAGKSLVLVKDAEIINGATYRLTAGDFTAQ